MIPSELCLDANLFVSSMMPKEESHEEALAVLKIVEEKGISLFEPEVVLFEVGSAIHRKRLAGDLTDLQRDDLIDLFFRLPLLFQWQPSLMIRALAMSQEQSSKGISDFCYVAVAQKRDIRLVTLDADLVKKGRKFYRKIQSADEFLRSLS
jgi:predicted nucleic acid-binding protein